MTIKPLTIRVIHFLLISIVFVVPIFFTRQFVFPFTQGKTFFFYLLTQIIVGLWLYTVITQKKYLPIRHPVLVAGAIFLSLYTLAGILGIDPDTSFGSSISRMSGLVFLYHIAMLVVVLVSTVRDSRTWNKILSAVVFSGAIVALVAYLVDLGLDVLPVNPLGGSIIGNSSYAGAYLLFSFFFALLLFKDAAKRRRVALIVIATGIFFCPILFDLRGVGNIIQNPLGVLGSARAATASLWAGLLVYALVLLGTSFKKWLRTVAHIGLIILLVTLGIFIVTLPFPGSMHGGLSDNKDIGPRPIFWNSALMGIAERPLLGWGPENYFAPFYKYFNPLLVTDEYGGGGEANSDKPHNAYLEVAVSGGVVSLIAYLAIFYYLFFSLVNAHSKHSLPHVHYAALLGLLIGYLLQNSFFFDTITSYIALSIALSYIVYLTPQQSQKGYPPLLSNISWPTLLLSSVIFLLLFYNLSYKPYRQQISLTHILANTTVMERSETYTQLFSTTHYGRTSLITYLMNKMITTIPDVWPTLNPEEQSIVLEDVTNLRLEAEKYMKPVPTHYRLMLSLVRLLHLEYALQLDPQEKQGILDTALKYSEYLFILSPTNPQNDWEQEWIEAARSERVQ